MSLKALKDLIENNAEIKDSITSKIKSSIREESIQELLEKLIRIILLSRASAKKLEVLLKNKVNALDKDKFSLPHLNELS